MERFTIPVNDYKDLKDAWELFKEKAPFRVDFTVIRCKHCGSNQISKYGSYKGMQLWWCQLCQRKFTGNDADPGMKISSDQIQSALSMYFKGVPLSSIRNQLKEEFDYYPSDSTIYRWVHQSTEKILKATKDYHPHVSDTWIAYESAVLIGIKKFWVSDLICIETHFLLASRLSANRKIDDIRILIESAMQRAHKIPGKIITRNTLKFLKAIEQVMVLDSEKIQIMQPEQGNEIKFSVFWHNILKGRSRIMHNLKSAALIHLTLEGWMLNYNYYSPQKSLQNKTPANLANLDSNLSLVIKDQL